MSTYVANLTDKGQNELEQAVFEGGIPVHEDHEVRVVMKEHQGGTERTQNAGHDFIHNAGVVLPHDDKPCVFPSDTIGRRV